mmetsp:Transcript_65442/g.109670  ORF Transcript_65442/g.109670 Transcript_65442/m.109670 type:complete len:204 (+) Transcript_65442:455-1066(+)
MQNATGRHDLFGEISLPFAAILAVLLAVMCINPPPIPLQRPAVIHHPELRTVLFGGGGGGQGWGTTLAWGSAALAYSLALVCVLPWAPLCFIGLRCANLHQGNCGPCAAHFVPHLSANIKAVSGEVLFARRRRNGFLFNPRGGVSPVLAHADAHFRLFCFKFVYASCSGNAVINTQGNLWHISSAMRWKITVPVLKVEHDLLE